MSTELVQITLRSKGIVSQGVFTALHMYLRPLGVNKQVSVSTTDAAVTGHDFPMWQRRRKDNFVAHRATVTACTVCLTVVWIEGWERRLRSLGVGHVGLAVRACEVLEQGKGGVQEVLAVVLDLLHILTLL
jgi:hypothetical protein